MHQILDVAYATLKTVYGTLPSYYVAQDDGGYHAFAVGETTVVQCRLPGADGVDVADFVANLLPGAVEVPTRDDAVVLGTVANAVPWVTRRQSDGTALAAAVGREGTELQFGTHDFTKPTTWFGDSVRVAAETLADSGDGLTFASAHPNWIDLVHGLVLYEDAVRATVAHGYLVAVTSNGVPLTQRAPYATTGGDYGVDFAAGTLTFFASQAGNPVVAAYSYATTSTFYVRPTPGNVFDVQSAKIIYSSDVDVRDVMRTSVYGYVQVFAPALWAGHVPPGPYPTNTKIELQFRRNVHVYQMLDEAETFDPGVPAVGITRGTAHTMGVLHYHYATVRQLYASQGMEIRVKLENDVAMGGERVSAMFRAVVRSETLFAP